MGRLEDIKMAVEYMKHNDFMQGILIEDLNWLIEQTEVSERRKILLDTVHGLAIRDGYKNIENYLNEFND